MSIRETGLVLEEKGPYVVVRADESGNCAGCGAKGHCHAGGSGAKSVEAVNDAGAQIGDRVVISIPSADFLKAAFQVYMVPVFGILAGAAAGQFAGGGIFGAEAAGSAAGVGGILGAVFSIFLVRLWRRRNPEAGALRPRVERIL